MLQIDHVTKKFGGLTAVSDVSFQVEEGKIVGLIGPNGSGKTTLFNAVSGVFPATTGHVFFKGKDITRMKPYEIANLGLARTFQIVKPFNNISALDNVMAGAYQQYPHHNDARKRAMESMEFLNILQYKDDFPRNLPLAVKKKLEIARVLSMEPDMILLDEVMGGLNGQETEEILEIVEKVSSSGKTILIIEHKMKAIMRLSHQVVVLNNGALIAEGDPESVVRDSAVIKAYLGDDYDVESY